MIWARLRTERGPNGRRAEYSTSGTSEGRAGKRKESPRRRGAHRVIDDGSMQCNAMQTHPKASRSAGRRCFGAPCSAPLLRQVPTAPSSAAAGSSTSALPVPVAHSEESSYSTATIQLVHDLLYSNWDQQIINFHQLQLFLLDLSSESVSYLVVFFSHNKSANNTFYLNLIIS